MRYDFAPLEGLTDSIYRRLHHRFFPGVDRYYMPFISPTMHHSMTVKEKRDLPPASSQSLFAVPQILTKNPEDFLWAAGCCAELGYALVNLNMGCPSGTVVSKGKGAGLLRDTGELRRFLDAIFARTPLPISVKTRIGMESQEEFPGILEVLKGYPMEELIVHPRVRQDFYKGPIHRDAFSYALEHSPAPVSYNGDLCTRQELAAMEASYPQAASMMLGRGLIGNPGMLTPGGTTPQKLAQFHDSLLEEYTAAFGSRRNAMFRLKENWRHLLCLFEGSEALGKKLRKATDLDQYMAITREILFGLPMRQELEADWKI